MVISVQVLSDSEEKLYSYMLDKLPLFLALSANSTFFDGEDSGLLSYRTQLFAQLPRAGIPAYFENYKEMQDVYETLKDSGVVESFSDLWWDIRISPNFGTLEIRICDACNDFDRLEDMINFYQALCFYASTQKVQKLPYQVLVQNKWNAARHGFAGVYHSPNFKRTKIKDYFLILINDMKEKKVFEKLNIEDKYIKRLESRADEKSLAAIQKEVFSDTNSLFEVEKLGILS